MTCLVCNLKQRPEWQRLRELLLDIRRAVVEAGHVEPDLSHQLRVVVADCLAGAAADMACGRAVDPEPLSELLLLNTMSPR